METKVENKQSNRNDGRMKRGLAAHLEHLNRKYKVEKRSASVRECYFEIDSLTKELDRQNNSIWELDLYTP